MGATKPNIAAIHKPMDIFDENKYVQSPPEITIACRNLFSIRPPSKMPKIMGTVGTSIFLRKYPSTPNPVINNRSK